MLLLKWIIHFKDKNGTFILYLEWGKETGEERKNLKFELEGMEKKENFKFLFYKSIFLSFFSLSLNPNKRKFIIIRIFLSFYFLFFLLNIPLKWFMKSLIYQICIRDCWLVRTGYAQTLTFHTCHFIKKTISFQFHHMYIWSYFFLTAGFEFVVFLATYLRTIYISVHLHYKCVRNITRWFSH